jgi:thiol-disulfide isomerase/thioredoxin
VAESGSPGPPGSRRGAAPDGANEGSRRDAAPADSPSARRAFGAEEVSDGVEEGSPGFLSRLGALISSPRRLARRDLASRDGKAGDDLFACAAAALLIAGGDPLLHGLRAIAAGRRNTAVHALADLLAPGIAILAVWVISTVVFRMFTLGGVRAALPALAPSGAARRRGPAVSELGARVTQGYVLASLAAYPLLTRLGPGRLGYVVSWAPWCATALLFGLLLREALDPPAEGAAPALGGRTVGWAVLALVALSGLMQLRHSWIRLGHEREIAAVAGRPAPAVDLPLLDGGALHTAALAGRPVALVFWATWCGPCMAELPLLERVWQARSGSTAALYAVNIDEPGPEREQRVRAVEGRLGLTMPIALDDGRAGAAYSITTIPAAARIASDGRLQEMHEGGDESALRDLIRP